MGKVAKIEDEVQALSPAELAQFRPWFLEYDWAAWDGLSRHVNWQTARSLARASGGGRGSSRGGLTWWSVNTRGCCDCAPMLAGATLAEQRGRRLGLRMDLDFEAQLRLSCETPAGQPFLRPFAPNPDWANATVFIIGTNPATPLRDEFSSFGEYWEGLTRDPEIFRRAYKRKRAGGNSKTTDRICALVKKLAPLNCLVTNVSWVPAASPREITRDQWKAGSRLLTTLVRHCRPQVLFCHGSKACSFAHSLGAPVDPYVPAILQDTKHDGMLILAYHHFAGQGLRKGSRFAPDLELPAFVDRIHSYVRDAQPSDATDRFEARLGPLSPTDERACSGARERRSMPSESPIDE
jgi:hypothetical protein